MKITNIRVRNVLGAQDIDAHLRQPVSLFCGFNGAGKSSLQESLRLAMQGETLRVNLKKDYPLMVSDGAKEGFVKITADDLVYEYKLPTGEHIVPQSAISADQLNCVLNAQRFATMTPDERRAFLTVLTKSKPNAEKITALLKEAGVEESRIELTIPMLRGGFPAACDIAKNKATEAKGAWKTVTGETYGSKKGETWEAPNVVAPQASDLDLAASVVAAKTEELAKLQQELGAVAEKLNAQKKRETEVSNAKTKVAAMQRHRDKLVRDQAALDGYVKELAELEAKAGTKPREGLLHDMARFIDSLDFSGAPETSDDAEALLKTYVAEFGEISEPGDEEALARIPAIVKSRDLMQRCVDNCKRDIAESEAAEAMLKTLGALDNVADTLLTETRATVQAMEKELALAREELQALQTLATAAAERDSKTAKAKAHHNDVVGWLKVAEQFAPDGIPSQLLAKALEPINKLLRAAAIATEWRQVTIAPDMTITAGGRLYSLHSESEKWMIDAMISAVISDLAGLRLIVLDRFDVLDNKHRPALLYWLSDMAEAGQIDSALVFGTLKEKPKGLPDNIDAFWIKNGELEQSEPALA